MTLVEAHISGVGIDVLNLIAKKRVTNTVNIASSLLAFKVIFIYGVRSKSQKKIKFEICPKLKRLNFQW